MDISWKECSKGWKFTIEKDEIKIGGTIAQPKDNEPFHLTSSDLVIARKPIVKPDYFKVNGITSKDEKVEIAKEEAIKAIKKNLEKKKPLMEMIVNDSDPSIYTWGPFMYDSFFDFGYISFTISDGKNKYDGQISIQKRCANSSFSLNWLLKNNIFLKTLDEEEAKNEVIDIIKTLCEQRLSILKEL